MGLFESKAEKVQRLATQRNQELEAENDRSGGSTTSSEAAQQTPAASRWGIFGGGGSKLVELAGDIAPIEGVAERRVAGGGINLVLAEYAMKGVGVEEAAQSTGQPLQREF